MTLYPWMNTQRGWQVILRDTRLIANAQHIGEVTMIKNREIESVKEQVIRLFKPDKILLFGSQARGSAGNKSILS